jgi:hypothetical protein
MFRVLLLLLVVLVLIRSDTIEDCLADKSLVRAANSKEIHALVQRLRMTQFFRIFKVNLNKHCQLWEDVSVCYKATCAVKECKKDEVGN